MMMLEKDPDNRFPSAAALATALETGEVPMPRNGGALALDSFAPRSATEAPFLCPRAGAVAPAYGAPPRPEEDPAPVPEDPGLDDEDSGKRRLDQLQEALSRTTRRR